MDLDQYTCVDCCETMLVYAGTGPRACMFCKSEKIRFVSLEKVERIKQPLDKFLLKTMNPYFDEIMQVVKKFEGQLEN